MGSRELWTVGALGFDHLLRHSYRTYSASVRESSILRHEILSDRRMSWYDFFVTILSSFLLPATRPLFELDASLYEKGSPSTRDIHYRSLEDTLAAWSARKLWCRPRNSWFQEMSVASRLDLGTSRQKGSSMSEEAYLIPSKSKCQNAKEVTK